MINVYFWPYRSINRVGHASLRISVGQGNGLDTYVSWWPSRDGSSPVSPHTYDDDVAIEGPPKGIVSISGLDEAAMRRKWKQMLARHPNYDFIGQNCSWAVKVILDVGTGYNLGAEGADYLNATTIPYGTWTPRKVYTYATLLKIRYGAHTKKPPQQNTVGGARQFRLS
ncbi:hypothetical protein FS764_08490 [Agrobacterium vitis]|uniref:hypothetical protein n=1 Tax=Agrobacterium vitis TaxID=373 RepID=UPI0008726798|nr:hypothetical protein [Agrobacterium vitis]MCE6074378.1 hypothetical protein [Agrobacterium vitis]MCF1466947.1 hypothetical protein [Agrobacterium vitis]MCM2450023.1 hypothetical protein [Agrobacterium vitis]MCM2470355.1 hypothetical protein [Agrobacterium vitis]MUO70702.1 hypothetical protein [Agrobacterium vitis]